MNTLYSFLRNKSFLRLVTWLILIAGILLRLVVWLQNRNLIIDEANLARNIYERSAAGLVAPLSYEQYAPPLFLLLTKCATALAGYGEQALRTFPLLSGIAALFLLIAILKKTGAVSSAWYPLFMIATGMIYVRYATEFKQYAGDSFVALFLVWLALRTDLVRSRRGLFLLTWVVAGSAAVWLSMPSVFVLAGVFCFYTYRSIQYKDPARWLLLCLCGVVWALQFGAYYYLLLRPDIQSDYLQNYHRGFFLHLLPANGAEWSQNATLLMDLMAATAGHWAISTALNLSLLTVGIVFLLRRRMAVALLLLVPVASMLLAAGLKQYSLIPRVSLFCMPLLLLLMGIGLDRLLRVRLAAFRFILVAAAFISMFNFAKNTISHLPLELEEVTRAFDFVQDKGVPGSRVFIRHTVAPAFYYYTTIHPGRDKWRKGKPGEALSEAHPLGWNTDCDSLIHQFKGRNAIVYSFENEPEFAAWKNGIRGYAAITDSFDRPGYKAYIFEAAQGVMQ